MQEWHRHDGFLKAMSLNIDVGCGRGLLPPEVQGPLWDLQIFEEMH